MITKREVEEIKHLADFHSDKVPVVYGDGEQSVEKMLPLYELSYILHAMTHDDDDKPKGSYLNDPMAAIAFYLGYAENIAEWKDYERGDEPPFMKYRESTLHYMLQCYHHLNIFWAYCVMCFGDYGVNPSCGWIEDFDGFHRWIDEVIELEEGSLL